MENYSIPDSFIQASSQLSESLKPSNGRLHKKLTSSDGTSWSAAVINAHQWFQVDFRNWTKVSGISTQGQNSGGYQWVKTYRVSYSSDGLLFADYKEGSDTKVFTTCLFVE